MTRATRLSRVLVAAACAALLACSLAVSSAAAAGAVEPQGYKAESLARFEAQLKAGEVASVRFNPKLRSVRVVLKNGEHVLAHYQPHHQLKVAKAVRAAHLPALTINGKQVGTSNHAGHKLRYIVGGALVVVVILVIAGIVMVMRRRRALTDY